MQYTVLVDDDIATLIHKVNAAIAQGWKPVGGICLGTGAQTPTGTAFLQAMTK
ncbi:MAG TPA: hypothetical protein DC047_14610 [Blastocatellia bacterium]|nr:hypothetical protein [Blastocatellia bacterium]